MNHPPPKKGRMRAKRSGGGQSSSRTLTWSPSATVLSLSGREFYFPCRAQFCDRSTCEFVGALVHVMAGVAFDPVPAHVMRLQGGFEALPQIDILHRLLVGGAPAVL